MTRLKWFNQVGKGIKMEQERIKCSENRQRFRKTTHKERPETINTEHRDKPVL